MANTTQDALARAIEYLGAVEVAPGRLVAFKDGNGRWRGLKPQALRCDPDRMGGRNVYYDYVRLWASFPMPTWWTPDTPTAFHCKNCRSPKRWPRRASGFSGQDPLYCCTMFDLETITADLNTGEEVPV